MIVVSDTSPLNYLVLINAIDVLPQLFGQVYVPPDVMTELQRAKTPAAVSRWAQSAPPWLTITTPKTTLPSTARLGPGEAQAIALAKELHAVAVLIDDRKGRRVAMQEGLDAVGTITVLELAAQRNLVDLKTALEALRQTTFRIASHHLDAALRRLNSRDAGQQKP